MSYFLINGSKMARGGHRSKANNSSDNVKFQASISASTLAPQPPYNRYFSIPIPEVDNNFYETLKREIQRQKAYSNEQKLAFAEAEAARNASLFEARKGQIEEIQAKLLRDEEQTQVSKLKLDEAGVKVDLATRKLQDLLDKKAAIEEEELKKAEMKRQETKRKHEKKQEESRKLKEERDNLRSKIESLKGTLMHEEELLNKLTKEEAEYNQQLKSEFESIENAKMEGNSKRKRNDGDENKNQEEDLSKKKRKHHTSRHDESVANELHQTIKTSSTGSECIETTHTEQDKKASIASLDSTTAMAISGNDNNNHAISTYNTKMLKESEKKTEELKVNIFLLIYFLQ